jgi:hypothetical protein
LESARLASTSINLPARITVTGDCWPWLAKAEETISRKAQENFLSMAHDIRVVVSIQFSEERKI